MNKKLDRKKQKTSTSLCKSYHTADLLSAGTIRFYSCIFRCKISVYADWQRRCDRHDKFCHSSVRPMPLYPSLFGRFFCGFACAFGSFGDALHGIYLWICKKSGKTVPYFREDHKVFIFAEIHRAGYDQPVMLCRRLCKNKGHQSVEVFSMIRAGNFKLGGYAIGIVLLTILMIGMCVQERFFCRFSVRWVPSFPLLPAPPFLTLARERGKLHQRDAGHVRKTVRQKWDFKERFDRDTGRMFPVSEVRGHLPERKYPYESAETSRQ